jgi:hypothetical protein
MPRKVGRNDPCLCGSGKKYKKCCLSKERGVPAPLSDVGPASRSKFRFEAGSYGQVGTGFTPATLCLKLTAGGESPHFVLVNPGKACDNPDEAADLAAQHLDMAFVQRAGTGSDEAMAVMLRTLGYVKVDDYRLVDFQPTGSGPDFEDEDSEEHVGVQATLLQVVEEQLRAGNPPETRRTLQRLVGRGYVEDEAKMFIQTVLACEAYSILDAEEEFDEKRYVEALRRLPALPEAVGKALPGDEMP